MISNAVPKDYKLYQNSDRYRWQAPELFLPDEEGMVYPCSKSDVYSLCLILWEGCNASMPWKNLTYEKLKEHAVMSEVRGEGVGGLASRGLPPGLRSTPAGGRRGCSTRCADTRFN
uniref:Protein kinase domain-containing protein n=1 Tax=Heliothis virescens TaxID=7102 RepID=A0A2A4JDP9_HELVI